MVGVDSGYSTGAGEWKALDYITVDHSRRSFVIDKLEVQNSRYKLNPRLLSDEFVSLSRCHRKDIT